MSFILGNILHTTPDGHLVEFDAGGSIVGTVNPGDRLAASAARPHRTMLI